MHSWVVVVLLMAAVPETGAEPVPAESATEPQKTPPKKVCRKPVAELGSRVIPRPICKTVDEWARVDRLNEEAADNHERRRRTVGSLPGS